MALNLFKIFRGTTANDDTGTPARTAAQGINDNMDLINNELTRIDSVSEKSANKAINLTNPNDTNYPSTKAVNDAIAGIESNANAYTDTQLGAYQAIGEKGLANGYAGLDASGKVPIANTYGSVDEIVEGEYINATTFNNTSGVAVTPGTAKIYQDITTGNPTSGGQYRWGGSQFVPIIASPGTTDEVTEGTSNLYYTAERVRSVLLTGINVITGGIISAGDSILVAFGKLQAQITSLTATVGTKLDKGTYTGTAEDLANLAGSGVSEVEAQAIADLKVEDQIVDGVVDKAPSQNSVFDALAGKQNALGYTPANDSEVVKSISLNGGTPQTPTNGLVDLTVAVESAEVHTEVTYTWNTGQSQIFTVADSAKTTDVYVNGDRLIKGVGEEWNVNTATGVEILVPLTDGDKIAIVSSATAAGGSTYDDTAITQRVTDLENAPDTDVISYALSSPSADLAAGDTDSFIAPYNFTLNSYFAGVAEAPTGSSLVVGLKKAGTSVTSSDAIIDANETTSLTGTAPVLTTTSFLKGDLITPSIVQVGSLTTGKSLKIYLEITKS